MIPVSDMRACIFKLATAIFLVPMTLSAQNAFNDGKFNLIKTDFDTSFIAVSKYKWKINIFTGSKGYSFNFNQSNSEEEINFNPAVSSILGGGVAYKNVGISYGFNLTSSKTDSGRFSEGINFITSLYAGQHVFDFGFQTTKGYFVSKYDPNQYKNQTVYRNDIANTGLFANYLYNFNYKRFSFNASFTGSQSQLKSAGSPLAGVFISYFELHANSSFVPSTFVDSPTLVNQISETTLLTTGLIGGYAYTFVLPLHFYFTVSLTPGIAFNTGEVKSDKYYSIAEPLTVSYKIISREAIGYDPGKKFYSYLSFFSDRTYMLLKNEDIKQNISNTTGNFRLHIGYRFN